MKIKTNSFKFKLWIYFIVFTAMIFIVLWLLQTVFIQSFYNSMVISNTRTAAQSIINSSSCEDINDTIDSLTRDNTILVFITDEEGNTIYSSDEFKGMKGRFHSGSNDEPERKNGRQYGEYRSLPVIYEEFLPRFLESEDETAEYSDDGFYIYGTYIDYYGAEGRSVLLVGATIDAVGSSVTVISMQLVWVTILSLIVGFVLSWFIARKFAAPVDRLSKKASKLGEKDYSEDFGKGFCSELDGLSDTLDRTNEKLRRSQDFQMELLANVSHDLRTPVTMIKGYAEMIRDISWEDEKQCEKDLNVIIKEADRLSALINEIMEYSELKSEFSVCDLVETDLSRVVRKAADSFTALCTPEGITVGQSIEDGITVNGNGSRLERLLFNLMDNAARHTGESKKIDVSLKKADNEAVIEVTDYGKGIPESEIDHIWDRYYTSRQRNGKGVSGLGLAIVKQLTEMHGGSCSVVSQEGKSCTFVIKIKCVL